MVAKITSEEASLSSNSTNHLLNGSSNQLSKAEEKIQGRGMSRSNASYGIQQLLQDQVLGTVWNLQKFTFTNFSLNLREINTFDEK